MSGDFNTSTEEHRFSDAYLSSISNTNDAQRQLSALTRRPKQADSLGGYREPGGGGSAHIFMA
jgi:hypothetical protein